MAAHPIEAWTAGLPCLTKLGGIVGRLNRRALSRIKRCAPRVPSGQMLYQPALTLTHLLAASARESGRYLSVRTRFLPWKAHAMRGPRRVKLCEIRYYVARNVSGRPISMEYRIDC